MTLLIYYTQIHIHILPYNISLIPKAQREFQKKGILIVKAKEMGNLLLCFVNWECQKLHPSLTNKTAYTRVDQGFFFIILFGKFHPLVLYLELYL